MNRAELKQLANDRVDDGKILLQAGRWTAAYYLLGYAVETALKACILKFVDNWTEVSRYEQKTEADARGLYEALTNNPDGVFPWIQQHW